MYYDIEIASTSGIKMYYDIEIPSTSEVKMYDDIEIPSDLPKTTSLESILDCELNDPLSHFLTLDTAI